jgi:dihydroorotase
MRDFIVRKFKDPHQHLREGSELPYTLQWAAHWCSTVVAMPNLAEPLTTVGRIRDYEELIRCYNTEKLNVIVPLYLTQNTTPDDIQAASASGVMAAKAYPRGKTSHSALGIGDYRRMTPVFEEMARVGMRLLLHPEHPEKNAWEGEQAFFSSIWPGIYQIVDSLGLYVSLEHISNGTTLGYIRFDGPGGWYGDASSSFGSYRSPWRAVGFGLFLQAHAQSTIGS